MDALSFYDVAASGITTGLDLGTIGPASSDDTQLRIYNSSRSAQADNVVVSVDGANHNDIYLSIDGVQFADTAEVGDIAPGSYSSVFWMRRITDSFATNGTRTATLHATPGTWSNPNIAPDTED